VEVCRLAGFARAESLWSAQGRPIAAASELAER